MFWRGLAETGTEVCADGPLGEDVCCGLPIALSNELKICDDIEDFENSGSFSLAKSSERQLGVLCWNQQERSHILLLNNLVSHSYSISNSYQGLGHMETGPWLSLI